ncbi:glycerophosphodiester phosphodiesterase [Salinilacihabitans rarus]|uniref:glycerophosphodiester phosphodiesterase n=1 Tax=Salinilacihabitans rarus TaxID=2961596 RepID=UPI0020C9336D|nr:glycerophosphodiester phosphodiesterase [Salinilacihabitans rarus]
MTTSHDFGRGTDGDAGRFRRVAVGAAVALAAVAFLALAWARERAALLFAHRGFASVAPENTVEAVAYAAPRADGIEVDVRRCGSGELVCVHDERLDRLAGRPDRVDEVDWEILRDLAVADTDATVARLDAVVAATPDDVVLNVELKERGLAADVLDALADRDGPALVSSFDPDALAAVRERDPTVPLAVVCRSGVGEALAAADALDCAAIHPRGELCFRTAVVPRAHRRGLAVNAWTADSRVESLALALTGVDGVFADRPPNPH